MDHIKKLLHAIGDFVMFFINFKKRFEALEKDVREKNEIERQKNDILIAQNRVALIESNIKVSKLEFKKFTESGGRLCPNCGVKTQVRDTGYFLSYYCPSCNGNFSVKK